MINLQLDQFIYGLLGFPGESSVYDATQEDINVAIDHLKRLDFNGLDLVLAFKDWIEVVYNINSTSINSEQDQYNRIKGIIESILGCLEKNGIKNDEIVVDDVVDDESIEEDETEEFDNNEDTVADEELTNEEEIEEPKKNKEEEEEDIEDKEDISVDDVSKGKIAK